MHLNSLNGHFRLDRGRSINGIVKLSSTNSVKRIFILNSPQLRRCSLSHSLRCAIKNVRWNTSNK